MFSCLPTKSLAS